MSTEIKITEPPITRTVRADRKIWVRGAPVLHENEYGEKRTRDSKLLDRHGGMCCVGIYLQACGVSDEDMLESPGVEDVKPDDKESFPSEAAWLLGDNHLNSDAAANLYLCNDKEGIGDEAKREALIVKHFRVQGVDFQFFGEGEPDLEPYKVDILGELD